MNTFGDAIRLRTVPSFAPALGFEPPEWTLAAVCASTDPEVFFPEKGGSTREAKSVCRACPVRAACLEYALEQGERFGIWGGLSERERREITSKAKRRHLVPPGSFPCPEVGCERVFGRAQAVAPHRRAAHRVGAA